MKTVARNAAPAVTRALRGFRVVFLGGPRQTGKTTLARSLGGSKRHFVTLDDLGTLAAARSDPQAFVSGLPTPATIDEVQRAPDLLLAIKRGVDERRTRGAYLLTGSADPLTVRTVKDTLAGRMAMLQLGPLTRSELRGRAEWNPIDELLRCRSGRDVVRRFGGAGEPLRLEREVLVGGFPEPALHLRPKQRQAWHAQYVRTYVERDVPQFVRPDDVAAFLRFVRLAVATTGNLLNASRLARDAGVSNDTAGRWLSVLESTFLVSLVRPLWRNVRKRLVKSPKLHVSDAGLAAALLDLTTWRQAEHLTLAGALTESWVHAHLQAYRFASTRAVRLHYFRSQSGDECDFVIESGARLIPIEVKASQTPRPADAAGLRVFLELFEDAPFGILLHAGADIIPIGDRIIAVPLASFL